MAALLGPPAQWEEGSARMTELNFRLAPHVGESTLVDENVESTLRKARETDWSTESLLNVKVLLIVTL